MLFRYVDCGVAHLEPWEHHIAEEEQVHGVDETQAGGQGHHEEREEPPFGHQRDGGHPGTQVISSIHLFSIQLLLSLQTESLVSFLPATQQQCPNAWLNLVEIDVSVSYLQNNIAY